MSFSLQIKTADGFVELEQQEEQLQLRVVSNAMPDDAMSAWNNLTLEQVEVLFTMLGAAKQQLELNKWKKQNG